MFRSNRVKKSEIMKIAKTIENKNIKIVKIIKADNIVFKKRDVHYAAVGKKLEKEMEKKFGKKIFVTTRSLKILKKIRSDFDV